MKIAYVSTFYEVCGVAEYSKDLVYGLIDAGHDVTVFANFPKAQLEPDPPYVKRVFHAPFLTNCLDTDISFVENLLQYDVVHFQFETNLYVFPWFDKLIKELFGKVPIVFTMHSSGMWPSFDTQMISKFITHEAVGAYANAVVIPMGIKFYPEMEQPNPKTIMSFGLGRNNDDFVKDAVTDTGVTFRTTYGHHKWLSKQDLVAEIQKAFSVSLIYPPVGASVSSSAANLALGSGRVLFVSPTNWFRHIAHYPAVFTVDSPITMKALITDIANSKEFQQDLLQEIEQRKDYIKSEGRDYDTFVNRHIEVYKNLL